MLIQWLLSIHLLACTSSPSIQEQASRHEPGKAPLGEICEWTSPQGKPYWFRIPKKAERPPNLLIMLHGTGVPHGWAFWNYPIANGQFRKNDIIVAPEGMTPGGGESFNFIQGKADGEQIAALIQGFRREYPIQNVYLYGHSQGAFFCYWFAGEYPELIHGMIAHAGNVLDVQFPRYAKENVAIGILHGKADAVVPVDCADRTEKIYKEQGYQKVRKYLVDGLTEQSGHWPLPVEVGEMLDWLDQVSTSNPATLVQGIVGVLHKEPLDLAAVVDGVARARALLKKSKLDDAKAAEPTLAVLEAFIGETAQACAARFAGMGLTFGPKLVEFRLAHRAFADHEPWQALMKDTIKRADAQEKKVQAVLKASSSGKKNWAKDATKILEECPMAPAYEDLCTRLERLPPEAGDSAQVRELLAGREAAEAEGHENFRAFVGERAKALLETHPELKAE